MSKLFVYGTLQRGYRLNCVLQEEGAEFETVAATVKPYSMLFGGWSDRGSVGMYPVVLEPVNGSPAAPVVGEVYRMPADHDWRYLDRIEGQYDRTLISRPGEEPVYMYVGKPSSWRGIKREFAKPHVDGNIYWVLPS